MTVVTLERDGTTVEIPVLSNSSGTPLLIKDCGKPNLNIQNTGTLNPRFNDNWSGSVQYTIQGRFVDNNAYSDAITLLDLIKSNSNGENLTLSIPHDDFDDNIIVAPGAGQDASCTISYPPGQRDFVEVDLSLTRISETVGGADQSASTPTASGSGPIQIRYRGQVVDLVEDVSVSRSVGRPQSVVRRTSNSRYPNYIDKQKTANDVFELSFEYTQNAVSTMNTLVEMVNAQLGRDPLTLDFQGVYGMGEFSVIPDGTQGLRHARVSGEQGTTAVPTLNLRRVLG